MAPDKTKWRKYLEQMFAFAEVPFDVGDSNISRIAAPVLIISGDNDGTDKVELMKTYQLLGGGVAADLRPMPKSQLASSFTRACEPDDANNNDFELLK